LPVVGTDKSVEAPPGVSAALRLFDRDVAVPGTTLAGLTGLPERSVRCSGAIGSPPPPRRLYDHEEFHRPAVRSVRRPTGSSRRLRLPLRVRAEMPSLTMPGQVAPPGVSRPFSDIGGGIRMTRVCLTRHVPSSGFFAPSTGSSPSGLADTLGPLPLLGFSLMRLFQAARPCCVAATLRPSVCGALQPRTLRNARSKAPPTRRRLSPSALVPRPWFQSHRAPFEAHHLRFVAGAFAPARPLTRLSSLHLGEP